MPLNNWNFTVFNKVAKSRGMHYLCATCYHLLLMLVVSRPCSCLAQYEATERAPCLPFLRGYKLKYDQRKRFIITTPQTPLIFNRHIDGIEHGITNDPRPHGDGGGFSSTPEC